MQTGHVLQDYRVRVLRHLEDSEWVTKTLWVVAFAVLTALLAQVRFYAPWNPYVPYTGQVLGAVLSGMVLGGGLGMASMLLYVVLGAVGLPVFSDQSSGIDVLMGATGGYIMGFILASSLVGWLSRRWLDAPGQRHLARRLGVAVLVAMVVAFGGGAFLLGVGGVLALQGLGLTVLVSSAAIGGMAVLLLVWSKGESTAFLARLACGLLGALAVYVPGVLVLKLVTGGGWEGVLANGALMFIPVDLAKVFVAAGLTAALLPPVGGRGAGVPGPRD